MSNSFKRGQLVKFLPDVAFAPNSEDYDWADEFRICSDISSPFVVVNVMIYHGRELIQAAPRDKITRCKRDWWVPSAAFALYHGDWLEDLPLAALDAR